jgi:HSP90 family molecular chaperone
MNAQELFDHLEKNQSYEELVKACRTDIRIQFPKIEWKIESSLSYSGFIHIPKKYPFELYHKLLLSFLYNFNTEKVYVYILMPFTNDRLDLVLQHV